MASRLRERMRRKMALRNLAFNTRKTYEMQVAGLARYYDRSPAKLSSQQVEAYLLHLREQRRAADATVDCIVSALRFFYSAVLRRPDILGILPQRMKRHKKAPDILSLEEIERLFAAAENPKHKALLMTAYGAGLRVSELVRLKAEHIESKRMLIRVEDAKGHKDRYTILPQRLLLQLREYWRKCRPRHWLFPGADITRPLSRNQALRVFKQTMKRAGLNQAGGIHLLRHAFATHLLEAGFDVVTVKLLLGHGCLRSTAHYVHLSPMGPTVRRLRSPLDSMAGA